MAKDMIETAITVALFIVLLLNIFILIGNRSYLSYYEGRVDLMRESCDAVFSQPGPTNTPPSILEIGPRI